MELLNFNVAIPAGPYFTKYAYLIYHIIKKRIGKINEPAIIIPFIEREYLLFTFIGDKKREIEKWIKDVLREGITENEVNIDSINSEIIEQRQIPSNYITDKIFTKFFSSTYSRPIFKEIKEFDVLEVNRVFEKAIKNSLILHKNISNNEINIKGKNFFKNVKKKILKGTGIKKMKSPFPSGYIGFGFLMPPGFNNLVQSHILSAYYDLVFKRELMYKGEILYLAVSNVSYHFFGYLTTISLSGFEKNNKEVMDKTLNIIQSKPDIPIEYVKNRAIGKILMIMEYKQLWGKWYMDSIIFQYNIDKLIEGIKKVKTIPHPSLEEIFGILLR